MPPPPSSAFTRLPIFGYALVAAAVVAAAFGDTEWRPLALITPLSLILGAIADVATVTVLIGLHSIATGRVSRLLLAIVYALSAALSIATLLCIPLDPGDPPLIATSPQTASYFYIAWKVLIVVCGFAYVVLRRRNENAGAFAANVAVVACTLLCVCAFLAACAAGWTRYLPAIVDGTAFTEQYRLFIGPGLAFAAALSAVCVLHLRLENGIDRAFGYTLIGVAAQAGLTALFGHRYTVAWYVARLFFVSASTFVFVAAIRQLVRERVRLRDTERTLAHVQSESKRHADRIRSLWQIAGSAERSDADRLRAVLDIGAQTIRPGRRFVGYLSHLEGETVVVDAVSTTADGADGPAWPLCPDARFDLKRGMQSLLLSGGCSHGWNDLRDFHGRWMVCEDLGWDSLIGTPLQIGRKTFFLIYGSPQTTADAPFAEDDFAYVDVLAAFVAHQFSEREQRERIQYHIEHDALTGLKNRGQFRSVLRERVAAGAPFALAFVDLDRLRAINETAGHLVGDELLVEVAMGLASVDPRDFVARIAGDAFALILGDTASRDDVCRRLATYADLFRRPFHTGDREGTRMASVTASFGAALFPQNGATTDELLRSADVALDVAKQRGGDTVVLFDRSMTATLEQRNLQIAEFAEAIEDGQLELVYQPTFELETRRVSGAEALVRWNHPSRGVLLPKDFLPFAERNGLMGRMSRWVIDRLIADLTKMRSLPDGFRCFFNLATAQIDDLAFIAELEQRLRFVPWVAAHLGVEITETAAINNTEHSMYALERFRKLGIRVAIDDFGTGYSSLSYLKRLPVDMIKVDRAFVDGLPGDAKDADLAELLLQIAARFGLIALAEGIETEDQLRWLRDHGCTYGQGFLVSRPLPFGQFAALIAVQRVPPAMRNSS